MILKKKIFFSIFILISIFFLFEICSYILIKHIKVNPLIQKSKNYYKLKNINNELKEYEDLIPYLNNYNLDINLDKKKLEENKSLLFNSFNDFKKSNNENILIQGDSWAYAANKKTIKNNLINLSLKNNLGLINAGIISYSISPMTVQLEILTNKLNIKPSIVIAIIDQTDLGDELHRYQSLSSTNLSLQDTKISNEFKKKFLNILDSKSINSLKIILMIKEFYISRYLQFNRNHLTAIKYTLKRIFYLITKTPAVLAPLKYGLNMEENKKFSLSLEKYINLVFKNKIKKLIFVTHPHRQHLETNNYVYIENVSKFVDKAIKNSNFKNNIMHINFQNNFYKIYKNLNLNDIYIENDETSHLKDNIYKDVYFPYIFQNLLKN